MPMPDFAFSLLTPQPPLPLHQTPLHSRASHHQVEWLIPQERFRPLARLQACLAHLPALLCDCALTPEHRIVRRIIPVFLLSLAVVSVSAQVANQAAPAASEPAPAAGPSIAQTLATYEGQNVTAVEVAGRPEFTTGQFQSSFAQQAGQPFSKDKVDLTASALKTAAKCDTVRVQVEAEANGVRVIFVLEPAVYFGIFQFPGASRFPYSRLVQVANYPIQTPFNADEVERDRQALLKFFRQEGYFQSQVSTELKIDSQHQLANVVFHVQLARKAKFGDIDLAGAAPEQTPTLTHSLETWLARLRGLAIRPGHPYHYSTVTKATEYLQSQLQKHGQLGAQVKLAGAEYHADTNRADIHFTVDGGPKTSVAVEGAHVWSWTRKSLLPVYQGIGADEESVQEGRQALMSYFQAKGFFDVQVAAQMKKDKSGNAIVYRITKEKKHKVADVTVSGNTQLPGSQLTPHLSVKKSHLFSPGDFSDRLVRSSIDNLTAVYRSEGFSSVKIESSVVNRGGDIQVSFRVTEGPRDIVNSIVIDGDRTFPQSSFAPQGLKLAAGQPYSQSHVEADRANIISHYLQAGYLVASFRETATEVSKSDPHHINVVYHIDEGPKIDAAT